MLYLDYQKNKYLPGMVGGMFKKVAIYIFLKFSSTNRPSILYRKTYLSKNLLGIFTQI